MANAEAQKRWKNRKRRQLQRQVMLEMAEQGLSEREAEARHRLSSGTIAKWFGNEEFRREMRCVIEAANWIARVLIARGATEAAKRLVALTECQKEETRRKACVDIIGMLPEEARRQGAAGEASQVPEWFDEQTASRLLAALAEDHGQAAARG